MQRVDVIWTGLGGAPYYTRLFFPGNSEESAQGAAAGVRAALADLIGGATPMVAGGITATVQPEVTTIDPATGEPQSVDVVIPGAPVVAGSGVTVPRSTQGLVQWLTSDYRNGRRVRGKTYIPGIAASQNVNGGVPSSTVRDRMQSFGLDLIDLGVLVYSRPAPPVAGAEHVVTSVTAWSEWAVLRSRRD